MIVKITRGGTSFKGEINYLMHDLKEQTNERVDWTHTHNLANDFVPAAVNEMYVTAESAEWLKEHAGLRAGGRPIEKPVRHIALCWAESDKPSREHMIATGEDYLKYMGWAEHQTIMVAHNDKPYAHLHLVINAVHPETGKAIDDGYAHVRSQRWALTYEMSQNRAHCTERLKDERDRAESVPRAVWMQLKQHEPEFAREAKENFENSQKAPINEKDAEWKTLKEYQFAERIQFKKDSTEQFKAVKNAIYEDVKGKFKDRWANYYSFKRDGLEKESLQAVKNKILADRQAHIDRRIGILKELKADREELYKDVLQEQKEARAELKHLQKAGLGTSEFFEEQRAKLPPPWMKLTEEFRTNASEVSEWKPVRPKTPEDRAPPKQQKEFINVGQGLRFRNPVRPAVLSAAETFVSFWTSLGSPRPEPISAEEHQDRFREAAENAVKQQQHAQKELDDERWREKQKARVRE